jgi:peptide/nickel transport system ATP-binding protein
MPKLGASLLGGAPERLAEIAGVVPSLREAIPGCAFAPRCTLATDRCRAAIPALETKGDRHLVACFESDRAVAS